MQMSRKNRHPLLGMALYSAILAQLAGSVLVGIFLGRWLDEKIGLEPLFMIIGLLAGLAIGVLGVILTVRQSGD